MALKNWTQVRAVIVLFIAAVLALLAWQVPLTLELRSRARWLADAQRGGSMLHKQDVSEWASLQPDAQNAVLWIYHAFPGTHLFTPIAVSQRQRDELLFGSLITGWPSLPAGTPVGVNARGVVHSIDPRTNMLALFGLGVFRVWVLLVTGVVILPWVVCRLWAWWMDRIHRLVVTPFCIVPPWAVVAAATASALVLSWGFFDRKYLWGRSAPNWQEGTIIAGAVFASLVLPRLVRGLFDARDRAATESHRCRACFYGPFGSSDAAVASNPILAHPRRCPECGTDAGKPPPRRWSLVATTWFARLTPAVLLIIACWWPIKFLGPMLLTYGPDYGHALFKAQINAKFPEFPETKPYNPFSRWLRMQFVLTYPDPILRREVVPESEWVIIPAPIFAGNGPFPVIPPTTPPPTPPPPEPSPQTPPPPP